jgi:signal peptidase I
MASVITFIVLALIGLFLNGVLLAYAARRAGSARKRLLYGVLVAVVANGLAIGVMALEAAAEAGVKFANPLFPAAMTLVVQIAVAYGVMQVMFGLSPKMALIPLGAHIGLGIGWIILTVVLVRPLLVEAFVMPTRGMSPTLEPGERFVVNKRLTPRRWDVVAHWHTDWHGRFVYCKRLVGLPGERIWFKDGELYVNNERVPYAPAAIKGRLTMSYAGRASSLSRYRDEEPIQLGADEIFLVGDNLDVSVDSRIDGPVKVGDVVGVADLRYWPLNRVEILR